MKTNQLLSLCCLLLSGAVLAVGCGRFREAERQPEETNVKVPVLVAGA